MVVDVTGLNDETWLGGAQGHTEPGGPGEPGHQIVETHALIHSDQEHVIERYTRHGDMLVYGATIEDPVMFTKPWVAHGRGRARYARRPHLRELLRSAGQEPYHPSQ